MHLAEIYIKNIDPIRRKNNKNILYVHSAAKANMRLEAYIGLTVFICDECVGFV